RLQRLIEDGASILSFPSPQSPAPSPLLAMPETRFDVLCIGNAIVDVLARVEDSFLARHALSKGMMRLIDEQTADQLYGDMGPAIEVSGGSAGNTAAGIA